MKKNGKKPTVFRTIEEYEQNYYPQSFEKWLSKIDDPNALGTKLAEESLKKIRQELIKK